jgi:hypothetical protein
MGPRDSRRCLAALALSCGVYLVPIATPHWIDLFGLTLARELSSDRVAAWKAANLGLALLLQPVLCTVAWWALSRSRTAAIGVTTLLLIPAVAVVNIAYLSTIPSYFLIESDTAPDTSAWTEACTVDNYSLDPVRGGTSRGLERSGGAWVRADNGTQYGILSVPGCVVEPAAIPELPIAPGLHQALSDGSVVYVTMERGSSVQTYWLLRRGSRTSTRLEAPVGRIDSPPLVSDDGGWAAWLMRSPEREASLRIEPLDGGEPIVFSHPLLQDATLAPVELDMMHREVVVNRDLSTFVRLRLDGTVAWGPLAPGAISAQTDTFRYLDGQWAGWDAYVEDSRYRLDWSTHAGHGQYEAPRGRSITSAAMDARGLYVAVSTSTSLNIGSITDTVLAVSTKDGREVFRKTLPTYTRSQVAFLGDRYFAYSEIVDGRSRTRVLRVADSPTSDRPSPD